jgi:amylosucrase
MIAVRKEIKVFADFNNRELIDVDNPHLFVFERNSLSFDSRNVLVVANFDSRPQSLELSQLRNWLAQPNTVLIDLITGAEPDVFSGALIVPGYSSFWLVEQ